MIRLRVVGASDDASHLILTNKPRGRKGSHAVEIDDRLLGVLQEAVYAQRDADRPRSESRSAPTAVAPPRVPPREIQRMLRAGMTVSQVARSAEVDEPYVEQFYPPVAYEREGVIRDARSLYTEKSRLGESGLALGDSVARNLAQRRVRLSEDEIANAWSATRQEGRPWLLSLSFPFRGRTQRATWTYDPRARSVTPANKLAADIGWVKGGTKRTASMGSSIASGRPSSGRRKPARRKPARRKPARKKTTGRKKSSARKKTTARRRTAARKRPTARKAARKRTTARRKPARRKNVKRKSATRKRPAARSKGKARKSPKRRATRKPARRTTTRARRR